MVQSARLFRYGMKFLTDRQYRNRVVDILNRHVQGAQHAEAQGEARESVDFLFLKGKRLFIAAGCDQAYLAQYLQALGMEAFHTDAAGRSTDPLTEFLLPGSRGLSESWDYYLLSTAQLLRGLFRRLQVDGIDYSREEQQRDLAEVLDNFRRSIELLRQHSPAPIFLYSYLLAYLPTYGLHEYRSLADGSSLIEFWHEFHLKLYALAREFPGVYVLDAELATAGAGKDVAVDPAQSNGIFDHPTRAGAKLLGDQLIRSLRTLDAKRHKIKCAVFDLDNTLWAGVLREDGPTGVSVNEYYLNVMEKLAARGILLAVCSKNDPVENESLPALLGQELDALIVSRQLNWNPKSQSLRDIAEELNIGLDSLAFFDDSPFERGEVAQNAPEVMVFTPEQMFGCINLPEFQPAGEVTRESVSRTRKYQQQAERKQAERKSGGGLEEFLNSCEFQLELRAPAAGEISRVHELLQRTNQLNATLTRPDLAQLQQQIAAPTEYAMRIAKLSDKFGDYGLIGYATVRTSGQEWQVLDLAFSCRSMGRGVEQALLNHFAQQAAEQGAQALSIQFMMGPRNQQMLEILRSCGFLQEGTASQETCRLVKRLAAGETYAAPAWLSPKVSGVAS